ncbi:hypothetical protein SAMN05421827_10933 [Pedobacter terrae]|uniref:Uncharacterized protein n=1 Tax=Pedobacter terrae TaxID=405671 RepID=A0A1G7VZV1_9SPHI|nr:hypothetical protein [Pedobacter terrae]SDG65191.1 hypothetical protein SAMN05421827_10933 [Pedobacter terrae]
MSEQNFIIDQPLPLNQDYAALKAEGLAYIQLHSGHEWTNLNNVDPGVTILEQVCYALTELGYCNDFPVVDILTNADGKLEVKDQFYLPNEILTTSPVSITDYRKCLIDGVSGVTNALIVPVPGGNYAYQVYLQANTAVEKEKLCHAAFIYLNKWRNLGEMFLQPLCLIEDFHTVAGKIEIADETQLKKILAELQQCVQQAIFPKVVPLGYDSKETDDILIDEIFNGPLLQHGWIPTAALGEKKDQLQLIELQQLILSVSGIIGVSGLTFDQQPLAQEIHTGSDHLLAINWSSSLDNGLEIYCKGRKLFSATNMLMLAVNSSPQTPGPGPVFGARPNLRITMPGGSFRDINSYYSIQNTFPEIYAVGADTTVDHATDFQVAQSRQLKGYLTLFDQVLANQFSQLANIGTLFSFKNAQSGTPSDQAFFYDTKNRLDEIPSEYPVPYLVFSPTYFYQSLYSVPHIRPLLKDNELYNFSIAAETEQDMEYSSWLAYQKDPYNPYIKGLMDMVEDDATNLLRRNSMLDHLLARHGESPLLINTIIDGSYYAGESLKDQVIFKSLYLQNLGLLTYFRVKAYNYIGAKKVADHFTDVPKDFNIRMMGGYMNDFIFNSAATDDVEALDTIDFIHYSAVELKLSLLFGLKPLYCDFMENHAEETASAIALKLAMWMILERKGLILIETGLLSPYVTVPTSMDQVILIFPSFIPQMNSEAFQERLSLFLTETMPAHVSYRCLFLNTILLEILIIAYADWHNGLIYPANPLNKSVTANASSLMKVINLIYTQADASK